MASDTEEKKTKTTKKATASKKATTTKKTGTKSTTQSAKKKTNNSPAKKTTNKAETKSTTKKSTSTKPVEKKQTVKKSTTSKPKTATKKKEKKVIEEIVDLKETTPVVEPIEVEETISNFEDNEYLIITKPNKYLSPKTILGNPLPGGHEEKDKNARKKYYAKDALLFAAIIPMLDLFAMLFIDSYKPILATNDIVANYVITLVLDFVLIYIVTYLIDLIVGEEAVKKTFK